MKGIRSLRTNLIVIMLLFVAGCAHQIVTQSTNSPTALHVVLLQFKPEVTPAQIDAVVQQSLIRLRAIPGVVSVDAGYKLRDNRPVHIKDYQVGILVRMLDAAALDAYGSHPLHQAFVKDHQALFAKLQVIDFSAEQIPAP